MEKLGINITSFRKPSLAALLELVSLHHAPTTPQVHSSLGIEETVLKLSVSVFSVLRAAQVNSSFQYAVGTMQEFNKWMSLSL